METMILHSIAVDQGGAAELYACVTIPWVTAIDLLDGDRWTATEDQHDTVRDEIPALWLSILGYHSEERIYVEADAGGLRIIGLSVDDLPAQHRALIAYGGIGRSR